MSAPLDIITIGRSSVDLYGEQIGGRLEDMRSFAKYIGGSPTNIAAGCARLGLNAAVITRVGDEHMGRFIREQLVREGVDIRGVVTDPDRLTALVLLGIRDQWRFPLIFYRENCADMALSPDDIDADFIAGARSVLATGTHLSHPGTEAAVLKALTLARRAGARTVLDIDYRPNLWGLAPHADGENRFIAADAVTAKLQSTLPLFDLIVGTEEEFFIAGGSQDILHALRTVRGLTPAVLVCKRGGAGAVVFGGAIPARMEDGITGPGFTVDVFNVLGAGDGFMAGLLKGWLAADTDWPGALRLANAVGALAVSRHGCTPAYPSAVELAEFLEHGAATPQIRKDQHLEQLHWSTNRRDHWPELRVFAFDHRARFEAMAEAAGAPPERIGAFKLLCLEAARAVAGTGAGFGVLCDERLGREALQRAAGTALWLGRPVERPGSRPLRLEIGEDPTAALADWPAGTVVKVLCFYRPDDPRDLRHDQEQVVTRLARAARANGLELLLEVIPSKHGPTDDGTTAAIIRRFYEIGVYPDWWKLEPMQTQPAWQAACQAITDHDPHCRGIVVLGLEATQEALSASFAIAAKHDLVKGFAVGRTIFANAATAWFAGKIDDAQAVAEMKQKYTALCDIWRTATRGTDL